MEEEIRTERFVFAMIAIFTALLLCAALTFQPALGSFSLTPAWTMEWSVDSGWTGGWR